MPPYELAIIAASLVNAGIAAFLGTRFLRAARGLGGLAAPLLLAVGFLALACSSLLVAPALLPAFDAYDAERLFLQAVAFAAIGLGYLLHRRHGDSPERGFGLAYAAFLLAVAAAIAPFVLFAALYPVLRAVDHAVYAATAALAVGIAAHLASGSGSGARPGRRRVVAGFGVLAGSQVALSVAVLDWTPYEPFLLASGLLRFGGLLLLAAPALRGARGEV